MASVLPIILALCLTTEAARPPSPSAIMLSASLGFSLVGVGIGVQVNPYATSAAFNPNAEADTVGGIALISMGLCLFFIAAVLTQWRLAATEPVALGVKWR